VLSLIHQSSQQYLSKADNVSTCSLESSGIFEPSTDSVTVTEESCTQDGYGPSDDDFAESATNTNTCVVEGDTITTTVTILITGEGCDLIIEDTLILILSDDNEKLIGNWTFFA